MEGTNSVGGPWLGGSPRRSDERFWAKLWRWLTRRPHGVIGIVLGVIVIILSMLEIADILPISEEKLNAIKIAGVTALVVTMAWLTLDLLDYAERLMPPKVTIERSLKEVIDEERAAVIAGLAREIAESHMGFPVTDGGHQEIELKSVRDGFLEFGIRGSWRGSNPTAERMSMHDSVRVIVIAEEDRPQVLDIVRRPGNTVYFVPHDTEPSQEYLTIQKMTATLTRRQGSKESPMPLKPGVIEKPPKALKYWRGWSFSRSDGESLALDQGETCTIELEGSWRMKTSVSYYTWASGWLAKGFRVTFKVRRGSGFAFDDFEVFASSRNTTVDPRLLPSEGDPEGCEVELTNWLFPGDKVVFYFKPEQDQGRSGVSNR